METAVTFIFEIIGMCAFFLWGYHLGTKYPKTPKEKDLSVCSCAHNYSVHDNKGVCRVMTIKKLNHRDEQFRCACARYDGVPPAHIYMKDQ